MNLKSHSTFKILFFTIYLLIGILLSLSKNTQYLSTEYNFILTAYFITGGAWGLCIYKKNIYIFEPATIVLGLTIITYAVAPLISINTNDLTINGFYVFDGCVEATIIYILAFCLFLFILCIFAQKLWNDSDFDKKDLKKNRPLRYIMVVNHLQPHHPVL